MCEQSVALEKLRILDTTLRDGAQTPHIRMLFHDKFMIAKALSHVGVDAIEIGFAGNEFEIEGMSHIAKIGNREYAQSDTVPIISCFAQANPGCIDKAFNCLKKADPDKRMIHLFVGTSKELVSYRNTNNEKDVIRTIKDNVSYARNLLNNKGYIQFSPEDASRTNLNFLAEAAQAAIENGSNIINITDTTGFSPPDEYFRTVKTLTNLLSDKVNVIFSAHVHNDSGNAVATTLKGILGGVHQIEGTILQLGERAGNVDWMSVVTNLIILENYYKIDVRHIKTNYFSHLSKLVSELIEQPIPLNYPVTGRNAFTESFGIHVEGILKNQKTYFVIPPAVVGGTQSIILGQTSIPEAVANWLAINDYGQLGVDYTIDQLLILTNEIKLYSVSNGEPTNTEIKLLVEHYLKGKSLETRLKLDEFKVIATPRGVRVILTIIENGKHKKGVGAGSNMVTAMVTATGNILGFYDVTIISYSLDIQCSDQIHAVIEPFKEAFSKDEENEILQKIFTNKEKGLAKCYVEISFNNQVFQGKYSSDDVMQSALQAIINAFDSISRLSNL